MTKSIPKAWQPIIDQLNKAINAALSPIERANFRWTHLEEKMGTLVATFSLAQAGSPALRARLRRLIADAKRQAEKTCQFCGKPACLRDDQPDFITACDDCNRRG